MTTYKGRCDLHEYGFVVVLAVHNPTNGQSVDVRGLVDTGAEMSMIRADLASEIALEPHDYRKLANWDSAQLCPIYAAEVILHDGATREVTMAAGGFDHTGTEFLIGRDILSSTRFSFDSSLSRYEITFL